MPEEIIYARNVIVAVRRHNQWYWYISDKELWVLDLVKLAKAFDTHFTSAPTSFSGRFSIPVVNEVTAEQFLAHMAPYQVNVGYLREVVRQRIDLTELSAASEESAEEMLDDWLELLPSLLVDFDNRSLFSLYAEPMSFESYVPEQWTGEYQCFYERIPEEQRYWIVDGENYFAPLGVGK